IESVVARWQDPSVTLTIEGPKTPQGLIGSEKRELLHACFWYQPNFSCLFARKKALERHFSEMQNLHPTRWETGWIQVENPAILPAQQTQGIHLSATYANVADQHRVQERVILITPGGVHQTLILDRPEDASPTGLDAHRLFMQALQTLRTSDS